MIEAGVSIGIALFAGIAALTSKLHGRIEDIDRRVDGVELGVARGYVSREEHAVAMDRIEEHMFRIESKLDTFIQTYKQ